MRAVSRRPKSASTVLEARSSRKRSLRGPLLEPPPAKDESGVRVAAIALAKAPYHDIAVPLPPRPTVKTLPKTDESVRLIVHGWHNVQPGTLSWIFPSAQAAILAVHTMRNAVSWAIVRGTDISDIAIARAMDAIVLEQG